MMLHDARKSASLFKMSNRVLLAPFGSTYSTILILAMNRRKSLSFSETEMSRSQSILKSLFNVYLPADDPFRSNLVPILKF